MLNRRILRIKAFKVVYEGAVKGGMSLKDAKKNLTARAKQLGICISTCSTLFLH